MKILLALTGLLTILTFAGCIASMHNSMKHEEFLRANGCQKKMEAETGKQVYCGKACFRPEKIVVFECAGGERRVEFR